jgi:hypothetical protein
MGKATPGVAERQDGSEVRIVVEEFWGLGLSRSLDVRVHRRESAEHEWQLTSNRPHPKWREMSVDEYVARGRSEQLRTVSWGDHESGEGASTELKTRLLPVA